MVTAPNWGKEQGWLRGTISNGGPLEMHFEDPAKHDKILEDHMRLVR